MKVDLSFDEVNFLKGLLKMTQQDKYSDQETKDICNKIFNKLRGDKNNEK